MNLLKKLYEEKELLNLTDELTIARFLYIRTGEIFKYNKTFFTYRSGGKKQRKILNEKINIYDVQSFRFVCASWAKMFEALLKAFGISAEYVELDNFWHAYVLIYIGKKVYISDITTCFEDIVNIKFGLQLCNFYETSIFKRLLRNLNLYFLCGEQKAMLEIDKKLKYYKGIYTDEVLDMIKKEIYSVSYENDSKLIERVFEVVTLIINIERPNIDFFTGSKFLNKMLVFFLDDLKIYRKHSTVYNKQRNKFMEVIVSTYCDLEIFLYEKDKKGYFKFGKVSREEIKDRTDNYKWQHEKVLRLIR